MWFVGGVLFLAMLGLAGRLCRLHLGVSAPGFHPVVIKLAARRGAIYDRNGRNNPLAVSLTFHQPFIDPLDLSPSTTNWPSRCCSNSG